MMNDTVNEGAESIKTAVENAQPPQLDMSAEVERLAMLSPLDYDREREEVAKRLGVRVATLDDAIKSTRKTSAPSAGQGQSLELPEPEPWHEAVNGAALLDEVIRIIHEYVALPEGAAEAVALWAMMTYRTDAFDCMPRLYIHSPEKGCGKTTLLSVVSRLVWRPLPASNISPAAVFRIIEGACPTLLLDESDTFLKDKEELRGVLNSGHTRAAAYTIRTVGDTHEPRRFSTWAAIGIAGIGHIHDTLESRSLMIPMRRKMKHEKLKRLRENEREPFATITQKMRRWMDDNAAMLSGHEPETPSSLGDRAADNWRALLAIAERVGGDWPAKAREAAIIISGSKSDGNDSFRTMLLHDLRELFEDEGKTVLASLHICTRLADMEERPWGEISKGKAITPTKLASLLKPFGIKPKQVRLPGSENRERRYHLADCKEAFERYLDAPSPQEGGTGCDTRDNQGKPPLSGDFQTVTGKNVSQIEKPLKPAEKLESHGCHESIAPMEGDKAQRRAVVI